MYSIEALQAVEACHSQISITRTGREGLLSFQSLGVEPLFVVIAERQPRQKNAVNGMATDLAKKEGSPYLSRIEGHPSVSTEDADIGMFSS